MVELRGTEKQVKWAEDIRAEKLHNGGGPGAPYPEGTPLAGEEYIREQAAKNCPTPEAMALALNALEAVKAQDSAIWWIDNRLLSLLDLVKGQAKKIMEIAQ